ncbi:MAG TPA: hypothetical protein VHD36_03860 [Pirellulales bacterium]|nr:hypothetical protein [Pirellulales bacterium]
MKRALTICLTLAFAASVAVAAELKSGLEPGKLIGPFDVVKCAGPDDNVKVGSELCYRCKYGARPMVMVFSRSTDDKVATLVKKLDGAVAANSSKQLAAFVNLLGSDRDALESKAKEFSASTKAGNVPMVVPVEFENGPADYGINPTAEVTVIVAKGGKVTANHGFAKGALDDAAIAAVLKDAEALVQ